MTNLNLNKPKRSSSRRKGDQYQDLMALRLALDLYIEKKDFKMYMEYDVKGNLDDIIVFLEDKILAYQIKYSVDPYASYKIIDFIDKEDPNKKKVFIKKFSNGWKDITKKHPDKEIFSILVSNHSINDEINEIINDQGFFTEEFIENRKYKKPRENRNKLKESCELNEKDFIKFLRSFQFQFKEKNIQSLEQYIKDSILKSRLGLYDISIYNLLRVNFENHAIYSRESIDSNFFKDIFEKETRKFLLPQIFKIEEDCYIKRKVFNENLEKIIQSISGDYVIVTGHPGSGKSTTLTRFLDQLRNLEKFIVIKYYCFVDINDNLQNLRLQAKTFRINLLHQIQESFSEILERQYDYSEQNLDFILSQIGNYFVENNQKLIIFLDGLDHIEKMASEIKNDLLNSLPKKIPKGIIFLVGTQDLHEWPFFLKTIKKSPNQSIKLPLFTFNETQDYLLKKINNVQKLNNEILQELFKISEGLPIYLRYISELVNTHKKIEDVISNLSLIKNGEIKDYYDFLWNEFEKSGKTYARHLCGVLASLRFQVTSSSLFEYQNVLDLPSYQESFNLIKHLVKTDNTYVSIFHNSFREYVLSKFEDNHLQKIKIVITNHLKDLEYSEEWFSFVFEYAFQVGDFQYVLNKITGEFIDIALLKFRSEEDIKNAILWGIRSAKELNDLIALSRLATLKYITQQRIEYHMNWSLLSKVLINLGEIDNVLKYTYSVNQNKWLIDKNLALNIIIQLAKQGLIDLSRKLFQIFTETTSFGKFERRENYIKYCKCLGMHSNSIEEELDYLTNIKVKPNYIEEKTQEDLKNYFPHIEAYLNSLISFNHKSYWSRIKTLDKKALNEVVHLFILRILAKNEELGLLKEELHEYISKYKSRFNSELVYYMALVKFPIKEMEIFIENLKIDDLEKSDQVKYSDKGLESYRRKLLILGYINDKKKISEFKIFLESKRSWWHDYLLYLLKAGEFIGNYLRDDMEDLFDLAKEAIDILLKIEPAIKEDIWNISRVCRNELKTSLYYITKAIADKYPIKLKEWFHKIKSLQSSELWTRKISIGRISDSYIFEFKLYKKLTKINRSKKFIIDFLDIGVQKITKSTTIKGGSRADHFFLLAQIYTRCGHKDKAMKLLDEGIKSTLIYGYRKDMTLYQLIQIMSKLNKYYPESALSRCADLLELVDWMPHLTDGKETNAFPYYIFKEIVNIDINVALKILKIFSQNKARWQIQDCLEILIKKLKKGDPEILWTLTDLFINVESREGGFSKQIYNSKVKVVNLVEEKGNCEIFKDFKNRLIHFVKTCINPEDWWRLEFKYFEIDVQEKENEISIDEEKNDGLKPILEFNLNGSIITKNEILDLVKESFQSYKEIIALLKNENKNFYVFSELNDILKTLIFKVQKLDDLKEIDAFINNNDDLDFKSLQSDIAEKFYEFGEIESSLKYYEKSYLDYIGFLDWKTPNKKYLQIIKKHSLERAKLLVVKKTNDILDVYAGFQVPLLIAGALDIFEDKESILRIYNDFFKQTKLLFSHLPERNNYKWIDKYHSNNEDFNLLAIDLILDELKTIEIDFGRRLLNSCRNLFINRPELLQLVFKKLSRSKGLLKERLIQILYMISFEIPKCLYPYVQQLEIELEINSFTSRIMITTIIRNIQKEIDLDENITSKVDSLQYNVNTNNELTTINIPNIKPSTEFGEFLKSYFSQFYKLEGCCNVLKINIEYFIHLIETSLLDNDWSIIKEKKRRKMDWDGYVHPQGFPYIPIITHFDYKVLKIINKIINNLLEKNPVSKNQLESIWRILQSVDYNYNFNNIKPRPKDIDVPSIDNKITWFSQLANLNGITHVTSELNEWTTIFEVKNYEKEISLSERYKSSIMQTSHLIKVGKKLDIVKSELDMDILDPNENITIRQAIDSINKNEFNIESEFQSLPLLIKKSNHYPFFGYLGVVSIPKYLIEKYNLKFKNPLNFYMENTEVIKFETWQEGYLTNSYSRNLRFYGTRLLIHRVLLEKIFQNYNVNLYKIIYDARFYYKSVFDRNATERKSGVYIEVVM